MNMYGSGKFLSKDRFEISKGLRVYFYDNDSIEREFTKFGLIKYIDIAEPVKFAEGYEPMKLKLVICAKK
jgi:hypothetical protein